MADQTILTDAGIAAYDNCVALGTKLSVTTFRVGSGQGYVPTAGQNGLVGAQIHVGALPNPEVLTPNGVMFTCVIPEFVPASGVVSIGEVILFSDTGVAIAIVVYENPVTKDGSYGLTLPVVVVHTRLAAVINLNISETVSLPSSFVNSLPNPALVEGNTWAVLDASSTKDYDTLPTIVSPGIAVRYVSTDGAQWGFVGYSQSYKGPVPVSISSSSSFFLDPKVNGFWLNPNEVVIVTVLTQCRLFRYVPSSAGDNFVALSGPLTTPLTVSSIVSIWRNNRAENALPRRDAVPPHFALHPGRRDIAGPVGSESGSLKMRFFEVTFDGVTRLYPTGIVSGDERLMGSSVFMAGSALDPDDYQVSSTRILFDTVFAAGLKAQVYVWYFVPSEGAETAWFEDEVVLTGAVSFVATAGPIPGYDQCMVFNAQQLVPPSRYLLTPAGIQFNFNPVGKVSVLRTGNPPVFGAIGTLNVYRYVSSGQQTITLPYTVTSKHLVLGFVNNLYLSKSDYEANGNELTYVTTPPVGNLVTLYIFGSTVNTSGPVASINGYDTGPVWRDPAGFYTEPNLFKLNQEDYPAAPGARDFVLPAAKIPTTSAHAWVFLNGVLQQPDAYELLDSLATVRLAIGSPGGTVSVLTMTALDGTGSRTDLVVHQPSALELTAGVYNLPVAPSDSLTVIVFAGGLLQPRGNFSLGGQALVATTPVNVPHQVYIYRTVPAENNTTEVRKVTRKHRPGFQYQTPEVTAKGRTFFFVGSVLQFHNAYNYNDGLVSFLGSIGSEITVDLRYLYSGLPRTRLITRDEIAQYLPLAGGVMEGVIEQGLAPVSPQDLVNLGYLQARLAELQAQIALLS